MSGRDFCAGAWDAPAAPDVDRAPLTQADDYTPAPARTLADAWDYETQRECGAPVAIVAAAGRQRGAEAHGAALTPDGARRAWGRA